LGAIEPTGIRPKFGAKLEGAGLPLPVEMFFPKGVDERWRR